VVNPTIVDISEAVTAIRQSKLPDPKILGNAGSFFKNPVVDRAQYEDLVKWHPDMPHYSVNEHEVKVPAGWLIERAGWKGKQWEHCAVHDRQALVLVNHNGAKGSEIWDLSSAIVDDIQQKFGIRLEREVNIY
jgi:UDP-N-acetylmuramate dehydrogenase